jgi:toxin ParE1/3/4
MKYSIQITREAENDITSTLEYLLAQNASQAARELWQDFEKAFASLNKFPLRGLLPPELFEYPDKRIREIHAGAYRIMYRVSDRNIYILFVADRRRNIQTTLLDRALRFKK